MMEEYVQWVCGDVSVGLDIFNDKQNCYGSDVSRYFNFDERSHFAPVYSAPLPKYEKIIFEENADVIVFQREDDGEIVKTKKNGTPMPQFLKYPVKDRKDFEKIKDRFNPDDKNRLPDNFNDLVEGYKKRTYPLGVGGTLFSGFFSILRELMGLEATCIYFYDNPLLISEILDFFTEYYIKLYSKVVLKVNVDYVLIWEDMSYKNGPLISPALFKEFILPCYKKFTSKLRQFGVNNFFVDTDGNCELLIPLFMEGGVNGLLPFEVAAGMDIEKVRAKYPNLVIMGGINKIALSKGRKEITKEIKKVDRMIKYGGYIPYTDYGVPPDVSFSNYKFYRGELTKILNK